MHGKTKSKEQCKLQAMALYILYYSSIEYPSFPHLSERMLAALARTVKDLSKIVPAQKEEQHLRNGTSCVTAKRKHSNCHCSLQGKSSIINNGAILKIDHPKILVPGSQNNEYQYSQSYLAGWEARAMP